MSAIKKSLNLRPDLAKKLEEYIDVNPGVNFTLIVNNALMDWIEKKDKTIRIAPPKNWTREDELKILEENKDVLEELAK